MNNTELTLKGITERLTKLEGPKYKKLEGSSYGGVLYEINDELCNRSLAVDIRVVPKHNALIFEMYPGINVGSKDFIPGVALYCQKIKTSLGSVNVERTHRDIKFRAETCYVDNPVTERTIETLEKVGMEVLEKHYENLNKLATGRTLELENVEEDERTSEENPEYELEANVGNVRDYLMNRSHHNAICESLSEDGEAKFCCNILTESEAFKLEVVFEKNGILTFRANYGENAMLVAEPYRYGVADYLNEQNAKHMYSTLYIGDDSQGVYGEISTSLLDGVIGDETIEFMEHVLLKSVRDSAHAVQMLSVGIMPREEEEEENALDAMLKKALADKHGNNMGKMPSLPMPPTALLSGLSQFPSLFCGKEKDDSWIGDMENPFGLMNDDGEVEDEISMDDYLRGLDADEDDEGADE